MDFFILSTGSKVFHFTQSAQRNFIQSTWACPCFAGSVYYGLRFARCFARFAPPYTSRKGGKIFKPYKKINSNLRTELGSSENFSQRFYEGSWWVDIVQKLNK
jgi:hypothetical protein